MRDLAGIVPRGPEALGQGGEFRRGVLGQVLARLARPEPLRIGHDPFELLERARFAQVLQSKSCRSLTVLVQLVWITKRSRSQTTNSGGFSSA